MDKARLPVLLLVLILFAGLIWSVGSIRSPAYAAIEDAGISVRAYLEKAVTGRQDQQTIYIIVQDQNLMPVQDAEVSIHVQMPGGAEQHYIVSQPTSNTGITQMSFPITIEKVGLVIVKVFAAHNRMEAEISTSFRIWW